MERLFLFLYDFFNKQRLIFIIFVVGISAASLYYASKIKLEEDITKFIPKDAKVDKVNKVFQNMKFKDKVIVNISLSDTNSKANPDQLILYANKFVEEIKNPLSANRKGAALPLPFLGKGSGGGVGATSLQSP